MNRMPDGNTATELQREHEGTDIEPFLERALDDLVWRLMDGQEYPRRCANKFRQINRLDILCEQDTYALATILLEAVDVGNAGWLDAETKVERIVREYLRDTHWHHQRAHEMADEEAEQAAERG
jgi:hypothetical protein